MPSTHLVCSGETISLDCSGELSFVSHAHSDHAVVKASEIIASEETLSLMKARRLKGGGKTRNEPIPGMKLLDSGHVLGSKMLYYANGSSFLYTSDFNAVDSMLFEAAKPVECDELLMECTYGKMEYSFPERSEVHSQIQEWASQVLESGSVIFGAYELGKAQELVAILNEAGITPLVSKEVFEVANIYNQFGKKLECLSLDAQEARESLSKNFVAILPFSKVNKAFARSLSQATGKKVLSANATGWSLSFRQSVDKAFCLSDHSDFKSLLEFAEGCNPKKIWCTHGFAKEFSTELRKKGFDAEEIKKDNVFSQ